MITNRDGLTVVVMFFTERKSDRASKSTCSTLHRTSTLKREGKGEEMSRERGKYRKRRRGTMWGGKGDASCKSRRGSSSSQGWFREGLVGGLGEDWVGCSYCDLLCDALGGLRFFVGIFHSRHLVLVKYFLTKFPFFCNFFFLTSCTMLDSRAEVGAPFAKAALAAAAAFTSGSPKKEKKQKKKK